MAIGNRYEFMFFIQYVNGNPNGDPDMGNTPRMDSEDMHGYITDVAIKRRIRNYIQTAFEGQNGMSIIMQNATNINKFIAKAKENAGVDFAAKDKDSIYAARKEACSMFYDVRTFGAVLSTGPNAGQVRGPVQLTFAKSIDPILPLDISITRMAATLPKSDKAKDEEKTFAYYEEVERNTPEDELRTMGRKQFLPYGLYEARGFISANLAAETGFDDSDLKALFEAILNMYEHDRSASKGEMSVISPLIIFKHVRTDTDEVQRTTKSQHSLYRIITEFCKLNYSIESVGIKPDSVTRLEYTLLSISAPISFSIAILSAFSESSKASSVLPASTVYILSSFSASMLSVSASPYLLRYFDSTSF